MAILQGKTALVTGASRGIGLRRSSNELHCSRRPRPAFASTVTSLQVAMAAAMPLVIRTSISTLASSTNLSSRKVWQPMSCTMQCKALLQKNATLPAKPR